jgi:predicted NAD/FAD-binding protein
VKIAIVGAGISGLVSAYLLNRAHEITVYEGNRYAGGHTHTVAAHAAGETHWVDTGFIVYNDQTYPNFIRLLDMLGQKTHPSNMSFSVKCERTGLEYKGSPSLSGLFADRRNLVSPTFLRMLYDIGRFNRTAPDVLNQPDDGQTLGAYLEAHGYSRAFCEHYIIPMGAAVWSSGQADMRAFPLRYFVQFFHNHGMLRLTNRPKWRVITGGSHRYVEKLTAPFVSRIRLESPVSAVTRHPDRVSITSRGRTEDYDHVVMASHADQTLKMLADATAAEREILGQFRYQENETVLHTDTRLLPARRRAWASWNYHLLATERERVAVTYNMNILQKLDAAADFCVTLNRTDEIRPDAVLNKIAYHHPTYTKAAVAAQRRHGEISGQNRTSYCGAYWGYGFHEDGVNSGLAVCRRFGVNL